MPSMLINKSALLPLLLIVAFLWFWLLIAFSPLSELTPPSFYAVLLTIIFGLSLLIGGLIGNVLARSNMHGSSESDVPYRQDFSRIIPFFWLLLFAAIPFAIDIAWRAYLFSNQFSYAHLRIIAFGGEIRGESFHLFRSGGLSRIYSYVIFPLVNIIVILGIFLTIHEKKMRYLILGFILGAAYSISTAGRFFFLNFVFLLAFSYWSLLLTNYRKASLASPHANTGVMLGQRKLILFCLIAVLIIIFISIERMGERNIFDGFRHYVIHYNVAGFSLLSSAVESNNATGLNDLTFGGAALRAPLLFFFDLLRQIGFDSWYPFNEAWIDTQARVFVGAGSLGDNYFNAFYTNIYPLYLDGRVAGVILGGIIYGSLFSYLLSQWLLKQRVFSLVFAALLFPALLGSNYNFPMQSTSLFFSLVILLFLWPAIKLR